MRVFATFEHVGSTLCGDRVGRASLLERAKRSFWRLDASLLEEVSYETLGLGTWRFILELDSDVASLYYKRSTGKSFRSWTQKWPVCSTNVVPETERDSEVFAFSL